MGILDPLRPEHVEKLERYGFQRERFEELSRQIAEGQLSKESNIVQGEVAAPEEDAWVDLPRTGSPEHAKAMEAGLAAIEAGEVHN